LDLGCEGAVAGVERVVPERVAHKAGSGGQVGLGLGWLEL
jgi:hypothetical protein